MNDLAGKTVAHVDDYGDVLIFTDGTGLRITSDDGHYIEPLDWTAVQARNHAQQGVRERARMERLEASLHPRDRAWLKEQRRIARERADAEWERTATPTQRAFRDVMRPAMLDMLLDFNRSSFGDTIMLPTPKRRRKARRS